MKRNLKRAVAIVLLAGLAVLITGCATAFDRGHRALQRGDYDLAIVEFSNYINSPVNQFSMHRPQAHSARGRAYLGKGDFDSAISDFEEALRRAPNRDFEIL